MKPWRNPLSNKMSVATATVATVKAYLFYIRYNRINLNLEGSWGPVVIDLIQPNVRYDTAWSIVRLKTHTTQQRHNTAWNNTTRHDTMPWFTFDKTDHNLPRWHLGMAHNSSSFDGPLHARPLFVGGGLSHFLVRALLPSSQLREHEVHAPQWLQFPSSGTKSEEQRSEI